MPTGPGIMYALRAKKSDPRPWVKATGKAIKSYGKNVAGGAKIVGSAVKKAAKKVF